MIVIFDDDMTVYTPTLMAYGTVWNWLSALAIMAMFSSETGLGIEQSSRAGWLMKPSVYSRSYCNMRTYTGE